MFVVSAACRKEICFPALCSAMPLWMTFLFLYIQELFILFIYFFKCQFVFLDIFPPSQHFHFLHLNVRNTFKGHLSIDKHFLCTWPACCSQPPLDSKLPAGLLKRTDDLVMLLHREARALYAFLHGYFRGRMVGKPTSRLHKWATQKAAGDKKGIRSSVPIGWEGSGVEQGEGERSCEHES